MKKYSLLIVAVTFLIGGILCLTCLANEGEEKMTIGERFHYETSYGEQGYKGKDIQYGRNIPLYKEYPDCMKIKLPMPDPGNMTVESAISNRRSTRYFKDETIKPGHLSQILLSGAGFTYTRSGLALRAAPSGGALYPIELYVVVNNVESLEKGLYHYQVKDSTLALIKAGDFNKNIHIASHKQDAVGNSPVTIIITARFERSTRKYTDRGYRYTYIECGAIGEHIFLQTVSLGMGTVMVGAFNDDKLNEFLGIDGKEEASLLIMPIGWPK